MHYRQRLYRFIEDLRVYKWHAPTVDGGRHLIQSAFVTMNPAPEYLVSYFFPRQYLKWFAEAWWDEPNATFLWRPKVWWLVGLMSYQKFSWSLHYTVGPFCNESVQDKFMLWTQQQMGLDRDGTSMLPFPPPAPPAPAPPRAEEPVERRPAPDGVHYTKAEFQEYFGGLAEWEAAGGASQAAPPEPERRRAEDGAYYTREEFL